MKIYEMSQSILQSLKNVCLENEDEKLYIANSQTITKLIIKSFMSDHYPSIKSDKNLIDQFYNTIKMSENKKQVKNTKQYERSVKVHQIIKKYISSDPRNRKQGSDKLNQHIEELSQLRLKAKDIVLNPFVYSPDYKDHFVEQAN